MMKNGSLKDRKNDWRKKKVLPGIEPGSKDSKSYVLTITP